jgi:hypothetical protein
MKKIEPLNHSDDSEIIARCESLYDYYCEEFLKNHDKNATEQVIRENLKFEMQNDFYKFDQERELIDVDMFDDFDEWCRQAAAIRDWRKKL